MLSLNFNIHLLMCSVSSPSQCSIARRTDILELIMTIDSCVDLKLMPLPFIGCYVFTSLCDRARPEEGKKNKSNFRWRNSWAYISNSHGSLTMCFLRISNEIKRMDADVAVCVAHSKNRSRDHKHSSISSYNNTATANKQNKSNYMKWCT